MADLVLPKPKEKYWITYIKQRIKKSKNFLGFISGQTGTGKSLASIRICEELDPEFNIDRVVFGGLELMRLINSGKLKSGSAIVFEEVGVELSSKNWQSVANKMLNYLMQTFRHRRFILIMNSPYLDFVDASTRKLFHAEMTTMGIDRKKNECKLKPQFLQYNSRKKKFYFKRLRVLKPEGKIPVDIWRVQKPSKELLLAYEKKKRAYTDRLNAKILEELEAFADKRKKKKELTGVQEDVLSLIEQGLIVEQIATLRNRSRRAIQTTMEQMKVKGYVFDPVYDDINHRKIVKYTVVKPEVE